MQYDSCEIVFPCHHTVSTTQYHLHGQHSLGVTTVTGVNMLIWQTRRNERLCGSAPSAARLPDCQTAGVPQCTQPVCLTLSSVLDVGRAT